MKLPPVHSSSRAAQELHRQAGRELQRQDDRAPHRSLGMPIGPTITKDHHATYGDLVPCDPTGGGFTVWLPKGDRQQIGEKVTVKNYSASTNPIKVQAQVPDTIDKTDTKTIAVAWSMATFLLIRSGEWICFRGDGCL